METRTAKMINYMATHDWKFPEEKQYVTVQGKKFHLLSRTIHHYTNEPLVSFGSHNTRELVLLDPASPLLQSLYAELKAQIDKSKPIETILKQTMIFVRSQFPKKSDAEVIQVANSTGNRHKDNPVAYLDDFIKAKTGFSRHQALLLSYLLDSLMQDPDNLLPKGTIYTHRSDIIEKGNKSSAHTWIMLQFDHPKQLFHLDSQWNDEPHLLEGNLETNPHLCKYGAEAAKDCWVRYSANPAPPSPQNEYKIANETFTITEANGSFTCKLTAKNKKFTYKIDKTLGTGSFGKVYAMTSKDAFAPSIVVKSFTVKDYPSTASDKEIADALKAYLDMAKHEAEYNKMVGGIGVFYVVNAQAPIKTQIITKPNGTSHQELVDPPRAYIAIKKEPGVQLSKYSITSATHYLNFCIAAVKSLHSIHAKQLVHSDVHNGNLLVEKLKTEPFVVVNYVDMTLCDYEGTLLSTQNLNLKIKPPEFKGQPSVIRNKNQDIHCLGRLFKEKYNNSYFSEPLKSKVEKIFNDMLEIDPKLRPETYQIINQLESLKFILHCIPGNADNLIQQLKNIPDANKRLTALTDLQTYYPEYIAKLSDLDVNVLVSLWDNDQQKNNVLQLLFNDKLSAIKSSPDADSDKAINKHLYCEQILFRLKNNRVIISEIVGSFQKLQSSTLEIGKGAVRYLEQAVKTADNFATCLEQLTPNQQRYLFTHGEPKTLRKVVNETNFFDVVNAIQHSDILFKKLGENYVKDKLQWLINAKLEEIKSSPKADSDKDINEHLYCKQLLFRLKKNGVIISEIVGSFQKLQSSTLEIGKGAARYLEHVVKTADNFTPCLKKLTPNQQRYLFTYGEPGTLRNLVNETNFFDVINATQHSDILVKKLGEQYVKDKLHELINAKLQEIELSPEADSEQAINEYFYCETILFQLKNNGPIQEAIANSQKFQSSILEAERGALLYLITVVKTADNLAPCLKQLTPNQQRYLFTHGEPETLRNLVNEANFFDVINVTQHSDIFFKKLGENYVKDKLHGLINAKLEEIKSSPEADSDKAINEHLYCEQLLFRLKKNGVIINEIVVSYKNLQSSTFEIGKGALRYLEHVIKTADNFTPCLKKLTPNQQRYLFTYGEPETLRKVVNETNFFDVVNATQHSDILFKKLGENYVKNILQLLVDPKLAEIKLFPQSDSAKDINEFFYCKQIPCQLKNGSIQEAIANYQKFQSSTLEAGRGAILYLINVVKTADNLAPCLKQLTPNQQCYLFTHGEPETLRNLVNEANFFDVINATQHSDILFKKLGEQYVKDKLHELINAKLQKIELSPEADSDKAINERFYCEQILFQLKNKNAIEEAIVCYLTLQSSDLQVGKGAVRYLEHVVKTAENVVPCLNQLTPNQQFYLFTHGQPKTLSNLVNENNFLRILNSTLHSNILLKKLDSQKRNQMIELMVRDRLANSTFKEAVKSFDTWNNDPALHKEILLAFNRVYYKKREADERSSYHIFNFFSKDEKLQASRALASEMTPQDWEQHKGALHGDLGEVGQRLKKLAHVRLGSF